MENLKALQDKAAAGDAAAQYKLAAHLSQTGRKDEAKTWLDRAIAAGHPGALYTQATEMLAATPDKMRPAAIAAVLQKASDAGGAPAARQLAVLKALGLGVPRDWPGAVALVMKAAQQGHPGAIRELALLAHLCVPDQNVSAALLRLAAIRGDWTALYLALRRGGVFSAKEGEGLADQLRRGGAPLASRLEDPVGEGASNSVDYVALEAALRGRAAPAAPKKEQINQQPDVSVARNLLTAEACDYVICMAAAMLTPSRVVNSQTSAADHAAFRTSDGAVFGLVDLDLAMIEIYRRLALASGTPFENCELIGVLRYRPGEEYLPHHDYLPEDAGDYSEVRRAGQRVRTLVLALNEGFGGGETVFPKLDVSFRGPPGDGIIFDNTDANQTPYPDSLHAGAAVTSGEKWVLTLWQRAKPFWFWV